MSLLLITPFLVMGLLGSPSSIAGECSVGPAAPVCENCNAQVTQARIHGVKDDHTNRQARKHSAYYHALVKASQIPMELKNFPQYSAGNESVD